MDVRDKLLFEQCMARIDKLSANGRIANFFRLGETKDYVSPNTKISQP